MAEKRKERPQLTTPPARAVWPKLNEPDYKFKKETGEYTVQLAFDPASPEHAAFLEKVEAAYQHCLYTAREELWPEIIANPKIKAKMLKEKKSIDPEEFPSPVQDEMDRDGGDTGFKLVRFKMNAAGEDKKTGDKYARRPTLFDAFKRPIPHASVKIGGGSVLRVNFDYGPFATPLGIGMAPGLRAVQVIELKQYSGKTADACGFDAVEDGFSGEGPEAPVEEPVAAKGSASKTDARGF